MKEINYYKIIYPIIKTAGDKAKAKWHKFRRQNSTLKGNTEIVTAVDKMTEKYLIKTIEKQFPSHAFLGEESGESKNQSDYKWIIDPIDGTTNFSIHNPLWSISIGLAYKNEVIFGIIYAPLLEEIFWAKKGGGAFLNNKKLKLSSVDSSKLIHTFCHGQTKRDLNIALNYYRQQKLNSLDCRQLGSAAIELCYVASSRVDSIIIPGANSWDVSAGALIAREAGAKVIDFNGYKWNLKSRDIIACQPKLKNKLLIIIEKAMK